MCRFFNYLLQTKLCCYIFDCISFVIGFVMTIPFSDLAFKSLIKAIRNMLFWHKLSKIGSKFSINFSNSSWVWLGNLYKKIKLQIFPPKFNSKFLRILNTENSQKQKLSTAFIVRRVIRAY